MEALREVLAQGTIGDVQVARAEMGMNITILPRATDWRQAGGCLLDLGIYCIQFLSMVFGALKPEKISAMGNIHETGTACSRLDGNRRPASQFSCAPLSSPTKEIKLDNGRFSMRASFPSHALDT